MAPFVPRHVSSGSNKIVSFRGILETEFLKPPPGRGFCFRQTYRATVLDNGDENLRRFIEEGRKPSGPPQHLHRHQVEYFKVEEGIMGVNIDGLIMKKAPEDEEFSIPANTYHAFFRHPDSPGPMTVVLSNLDNGRDQKLDRVFFENWYGFWHDSLMHDGKMDYIAFVQLYDAGDAYVFVPHWVPFRKTVAYCWGVVVGRWLGTLMGYQPFHKEYTTDWDWAVAKMKGVFPLSYLTHTSYKLESSCDPLPPLSKPGKLVNGNRSSDVSTKLD